LHNVRKALMTVPEVRTTVSKAGQPEDGTDPKTISMAEVFVDVKPPEQWRKGLTREQLIEDMDHAVSVLPGMQPTFSQPIRDNVLESISQIDGQIVIKISGDDLDVLRHTTEAVEKEIRQAHYRYLLARSQHFPQAL
jgi:cobalt-zinc-cadmium resistance protein CzcA